MCTFRSDLLERQVLPLTEESDQVNQELFSMDDVKVEVMRARGAGGQVRSFDSTWTSPFNGPTAARSM